MKTVSQQLDKLQEEYEKKAYIYRENKKREKFNFWLGRAKGINDALQEDRQRKDYKEEK